MLYLAYSAGVRRLRIIQGMCSFLPRAMRSGSHDGRSSATMAISITRRQCRTSCVAFLAALAPRRLIFLLAAALLPVTAPAQETYPARPVRVVVGLAPGGGTDIQAPLCAQKLTESLNRSFVVENRPGAGGTIAYSQVAKSPPDGYTLLGITSGFTITPAVYRQLSYDPIKDFAPISLVAQAPFLLVVHPALPATSVKDLLALARNKPGALDCGSAGVGTSTHMAFELFRSLARVKISHIPYKGTGPALIDVMAGQVHMLFGNVLSTLTYVKTGRLRALAVTTAARSLVLPDLPTIAEAGLPAYENSTWHG